MNICDPRKITVKDSYDVIVVGGGIGGVAAAVAAARNGAKTLLMEKQINLGGLATVGLISWYEPLCDGKGDFAVITGGQKQLFLFRIGQKPALHQSRRQLASEHIIVSGHGPALLFGGEHLNQALLQEPRQQPSRVAPLLIKHLRTCCCKGPHRWEGRRQDPWQES